MFEALRRAMNNFRRAVADDNPIESEVLRFLSILFLLISAIFIFPEYKMKGILLTKNFTIRPDFASGIVGLFLIAPLYMRGIFKWNNSIYSIISFVLILTVFSSFINILIGDKGLGQEVRVGVLVAAFALSWLGLRAIAGFAWIIVLVAAIFSLSKVNVSLGFYGYIYVCAGALGLILHSGLNPGELMYVLKNEYSREAIAVQRQVTADVGALGEKIRRF